MQGHRRGLPIRGSLALFAFAALVLIPGAGAMTMSNGSNGGLPELNVLSNRADLVSGGDALVQVVLPNASIRRPFASASTAATSRRRSPFAPNGAYEGVVTGLANGANDLMATMRQRPDRPSHDHEPPERRPDLRRARRCSRGSARPVDRLPGADATRSATAAPLVTFSLHGRDRRTRSSRTTRRPAGRVDRDDDDRPGRDGAVHRPPRARRDGPRPLRRRRARDPPAAVDAWAPQAGWNHKVLYQFGGGTAPWHTNGAPSSDARSTSRSRAGFMVANNNLEHPRQRTRTTSSPPRR